MAKNKKLSKKELEEIRNIQERMQAAKLELGQLALAEIDLKNRKVNVENYLVETKNIETKLVESLEKNYGKGSIDINEGTFIPDVEQTEKDVVPTVE